MQHKTAIVTGGNTGLGYHCAKSVAERDHAYHVVLACRNLPKADAAAETLRTVTGNPNISAMKLDLASLSSVRGFCDSFSRADLPPLHAVVCNAGLSAAGTPGTPRTTDGIEMIFGVNHLGHFLLTNLLLNHMGDDGRIVFVTSDLHDPPRFFPAKPAYDNARSIANRKSGMTQYCTSKLCNIYCCHEMARLLAEHTDRRITVNSFNPGAMSDTGFTRPTGNVLVRGAVKVVGGIMGTVIGKASTAAESGPVLASLVTEPSFGTATGKYFDRGVEVPSSALSYDMDKARELWTGSMELSGLSDAETIFAPSRKQD
ncbi:SDR family NAD(P)-dependent oxidoreductase [Lentzea sp. NBC_00516]|uniref:SDR family NAD(P)-dependent oxidoreductase n=1 Tax=Lentzea sp. NBC_00516 TaxID=2903582 RepID=UPI002E80478A|nr:SDR family NAD(P)-dependent oxidoreductase [Lentzea sp. NBC_00516]WUD27357.1 SDR family NAD(P)-dependent oxidoreductase [Lentzea sp. NBC_00516]